MKNCDCIWEEQEFCGECEDALTDRLFQGSEATKHDHSCLIYICTCKREASNRDKAVPICPNKKGGE
jgi:hypothetical protein